MLEKILNINPNGSYKRKKKTNSKTEFPLHYNVQAKHSIKDTITFSPAALFLAHINWELKEIQYPTSEHVLLKFVIEGIEFYVEINLNELYANVMQQFSILNVHRSKVKEKAILVKVSVAKDKITTVENPMKFEIPFINQLYDRILELELHSALTNEDEVMLKNLTDGIKEQLLDEFRNILYGVYTFLDKLGKFNLVKNYLFAHEVNDPLIIERITVIHG